ncbi:MAG: hypothetical protein N2C14_18945, partial [Planctomycetales bacterium]
MLQEGVLLKDIAKELGYSPRGLKLALDNHLAVRGETLPDGRTRRGNAGSGERANGRVDDEPIEGNESPPTEGKEANDDDLAE